MHMCQALESNVAGWGGVGFNLKLAESEDWEGQGSVGGFSEKLLNSWNSWLQKSGLYTSLPSQHCRLGQVASHGVSGPAARLRPKISSHIKTKNKENISQSYLVAASILHIDPCGPSSNSCWGVCLQHRDLNLSLTSKSKAPIWCFQSTRCKNLQKENVLADCFKSEWHRSTCPKMIAAATDLCLPAEQVKAMELAPPLMAPFTFCLWWADVMMQKNATYS